jgi:hypothetical protein
MRPSMQDFIPLVWKFSRQSAPDTNAGPSSVANCGLTFVFDIRHPNWYTTTKIRALRVSVSVCIELNYEEPKFTLESKLRHCWP